MHTSSPTSEPWSYWCSLTALGYRHYSTFSHAREAFIKSCAAWVNLLSKGLQTFLDLKRFPVSPFLWRSDAQRVRKLLSARNHALAEAAVHRVERRHSLDWVSPHRSTARVAPDDCEHIHLEMMIDDWWLMIDDWWLMIDDWWLMIDDWWLCLHETFWSMWTRGIKRISVFMTCWTRWAIMCGSTLPMRKPSLWIIHILVKMKWMMCCRCCEYDEYCGYTQLLL